MRDACSWCREPLTDVRASYCSKKCRQTAFRLRRRRATDAADGAPKRLAYADPPYPGKASLYRGDPLYAGNAAEVDHVSLLERLDTFDGWALSTSAEALRRILPLCPEGVRVCAWVKPCPPHVQTFGLHNLWEPVIVKQARRLRPGRADCLIAKPARLGGYDLIGRKPLAFVAWLFGALGAVPGLDTLDDLFPGTGIVGRAWANLSLGAGVDASLPPASDMSPLQRDDASRSADSDTSSQYFGDASSKDLDDTSLRDLDDASPRAADDERRSA